MKRTAVFAAFFAMLIAGVSASQAQAHPGPGMGAGPQGFPPQLARLLELTDTQRSQIKDLLEQEKATNQSLRENERTLVQNLLQLERATSLDEQTLSTTAATLASVQASLTVSRVKTRFKIRALLTDQQRALADKIEPRPEDLQSLGEPGSHEPPPADAHQR
jgi:Spy/CpxP family protein refolding chaperone